MPVLAIWMYLDVIRVRVKVWTCSCYLVLRYKTSSRCSNRTEINTSKSAKSPVKTLEKFVFRYSTAVYVCVCSDYKPQHDSHHHHQQQQQQQQQQQREECQEDRERDAVTRPRSKKELWSPGHELEQSGIHLYANTSGDLNKQILCC